MDKCSLQYKYPTKELQDKYKINCDDKTFENYKKIDKFNNKEFLDFVDDKYISAFPNKDSPFIFSDKYIEEENQEICDPKEYSLKPQQKFLGQIINPATNINSSLVFHGLGSGKTCTSLVVGEAFKSTSKTHLLYVVPAPLVQQYRDEIIGELKKINEKNEIWSCTSQCVITKDQKGDEEVGDFYTNIDDQLQLESLKKESNKKREQLLQIADEIKILNKEESTDLSEKAKLFINIQNELNIIERQYNTFKEQKMMNVVKVFEIVSHTKFINDLFQVQRDGRWLKNKYLTDNKSPLLNKGSLLVIDEIQRLISAEGSLYKKLYTAIYQYAHPELRILLLSATPIYDNPYELALTMNILRPRIPFPLSKEKFYSFFLGEYDKDDNCVRVNGKNFINENSCVINKDLLRLLCSGYVSYFRGGNPNAYPYKRVITMEHKMPSYQKSEYTRALISDIKRDSSLSSKLDKEDAQLIELFNKNEFTDKDDKVSGIYVNTQQICNIALPETKSDIIDKLKAGDIKKSLNALKSELSKITPKPKSYHDVLFQIRKKGYSEKFCKIIELSSECNGPVFIFSNWLQFGVEALSIILEACGYIKYPNDNKKDELKPKYFIWNSETSQDKDLVSKARATFNSLENKNGSKLKIILGTRSIMEGVSFKNVKQVHITDPWWNESRIEQILARAVRFCSHSQLPLEEQWTDIYRHYSVLPLSNDKDLIEAIKEASGIGGFKNFHKFTIEQKMLMSSLKKALINSEFDDILKETAYDCDLNKKGNIIRLEEHIVPIPSGNYQIYFKNPKTLTTYLREGIPEQITFEDIQKRTYSYPNTSTLPLLFTECETNDKSILVKMTPEEAEILDDKIISKNLTLYENIECWKNDNTYEKIMSEINKSDPDIKEYFNKIINNFNLIQEFRRQILGEKINTNKKIGTNFIKFNTDIQASERSRTKLFKCLESIRDNPNTIPKLKNKIKKMLQSEESRPKIDKKIIDIIFTYQYLPESELENLMKADSQTINELHQLAKSSNS